MENKEESQPSQAPSTGEPPKRSGRLYQLIRERWPEYILEVIVIIFSITISFALDEWKEKERKKEVEQIYLKSLAGDLERDRITLQEVIAETQQIVGKARTLVAITNQNDSTKLGYEQIMIDTKFVFKRPRFVAEDATFSDLKSTGNMQLITNYTLKSDLFDYYKTYESVGQVESAELQTTNAVIAPALLKRFPVSGTGSDKKVDLASLLTDMEFKNAMYVRQTTREELLGDYQELYKQANTIQTLLKQQLTQ